MAPLGDQTPVQDDSTPRIIRDISYNPMFSGNVAHSCGLWCCVLSLTTCTSFAWACMSHSHPQAVQGAPQNPRLLLKMLFLFSSPLESGGPRGYSSRFNTVTQILCLLEPRNVTLFGNRIFIVVISKSKSRHLE